MSYIRYKQLTKYFNFSKVLDKNNLPKYVKDYVFKDEKILIAYKTSNDHGIFTDKKLLLYDNYNLLIKRKQVYMIPYKSISTTFITYEENKAELNIILNSGYRTKIRFIDMDPIDKKRLRLLFSYILKVINEQKIDKKELVALINNNVGLKVCKE